MGEITTSAIFDPQFGWGDGEPGFAGLRNRVDVCPTRITAQVGRAYGKPPERPTSSRETSARPKRVATLVVVVTANPSVAVRRPRVARVAIIAVGAESEAQAKTERDAEAGKVVTVPKTSANETMSGKGVRRATNPRSGKAMSKAASAEPAVARTSASESQGTCRSCCSGENAGCRECDRSVA